MFSDDGLKDTRTFLIAALPVSLGYDGSDDLLDPTRGFRLGGRISPEISAHGGSFTYARAQIDASAYHPVSDSVVAGRPRPARHDLRRRRCIDIAPSRRFYSGGGGSVRGYGYQQLGPKDVDGDPIGGRGLAEFALEARVRLKQFGGNFGIVPVPRRRHADAREIAARFRQLAVRRRPRRALLFELRPDPHRCRHAAQSPAGRRAGRGHRLARPGLLRWPKTRHRPTGRSRRAAGCASDWPRRLLNELLALFVALLVLLAGRAGAARHRARPPLHRRPHRQIETASGLQHPHRPDRRVDLRRVAAEERRGPRQPRRVPDLARDRARLGAGRLARQLAPHRQPDRRAGHAAPRCPSSSRARPKGPILPGSTSTSASCGSTGSSSARRSPARRAAAACAARPTSARAGRWSSSRRCSNNGGDRLALKLDAEPDRDRFDLDGAGDRAGQRPGAGAARDQALDRPDRRRRRQLERAGAAGARSTCRAARPRGSRSASTRAATGLRASSRRRNSSRAGCSG